MYINFVYMSIWHSFRRMGEFSSEQKIDLVYSIYYVILSYILQDHVKIWMAVQHLHRNIIFIYLFSLLIKLKF